jgi:DNA-binding transcriptional LysR family regulator
MELPDSVYVAQPLGSAYAVMVASPDYLKRHGTPRTREELSAHTLLMLESPVSPPDEWHIESEADAQIWKIQKSPLQVNVPDVMRAALLQGAGIGTLATYTAVDDLVDGKLVRVLPHYRLRPFTVFAVYPSRRYLDAKVRTLLEHLRSTLSSSLNNAIERIEALARADSLQA